MTPTDETQTGLKVTHTVVLVDRDTATRWLNDANNHNREISFHRWRDYAKDMIAGRWHFNGETIQFDHNGVLLNGQHRLLAVKACGIPQQFLVVRGLNPQTQTTMDQGTRRSPSDQLRVSDIYSEKTVAAAARVYMQWTSGRLFGDLKVNRINTTELVEWAKSNPNRMEQLHKINSERLRRAGGRPSVILAVALRFYEISPDDAETFFNGFISGANLQEGDPVLTLRNRLRAAKGNEVRYTDRDLIGFCTLAWNATRRGRKIEKFQRPRGGSWTAATFPRPI